MEDTSFNENNNSISNPLYRKLKQWLNFQKSHRYINPESVVKLDYNDKEKPYRIIIYGLQNFTGVQDIKATLFSDYKKQYFGRSYSSIPVKLVRAESAQGKEKLEFDEPIVIYFHTKIIFEVFALKLNKKQVPVSQNRIGVASADVLHEGEKKLRLYQGTPRMYLKSGQETEKQAQEILVISIQEFEQLESCIHLLPESILCGSTELLPGIETEKLPNDEKSNQILLIKTNKIFLREIKLLVPESLDKQLLQHARLLREQKINSNNTKDLSDVYVAEVKLVIIFHNGWTAVNSKAYQNFVILNNSNKKQQLYEYTAEIDLDGVFYHEYASVVLELHYSICMPLQQRNKEFLNIPIGWCPIFLNASSFGQNNVKFQEDFLVGPGHTLNNQKLFDLQFTEATEQYISICGRLNLSGIQEDSYQNQKGKEKKPQVNDIDVTIANQLDINLKNKEQKQLQEKYEQEIKQMKRQHQLEIDKILEKIKREIGENSDIATELYYKEILRKKEEDLNQQLDQVADAFRKKEQEKDNQIVLLRDLVKGIGPSQMNSTIQLQQQQQFNGSGNFFYSSQYLQPPYTPAQLTISPQAQIDNEIMYNVEDSSKGKLMNYTPPYQPDSSQIYVPATGDKDISRVDKAILLQLGIKGGLLDSSTPTDNTGKLEDKRLSIETDDPLKANTIYIQALGIKSIPGTLYSSSIQSMQGEVGQFQVCLPERLYMTLNFFDFPPFKTEILCFEGRQSPESSIEKGPPVGVPLVLVREAALKSGLDQKEPLYTYMIDPSERGQSDVYLKLAKYLHSKTLSIDIWDADSLMLFGSAKVQLKNLMRQGRQQAIYSKEIEIFDREFVQVKGSLLLLLKNVGSLPRIQIQGIQNDKPQVKLTESENGVIKRKIISNRPLKIPENFQVYKEQSHQQQQQQQDSINNQNLTPEERRLRKINRYKNFVESVNVNENSKNSLNRENPRNLQDQNEQKANEQRELENFRELKKKDVLRETVQAFMSKEKIISVSFGEAAIVSLNFVNPFEREQSFQVIIEDPELKNLPKPELMIINNPNEWKFYVENLGFNRPPQYNLIADNVFLLAPFEKITLLFKFLCLRDSENYEEKSFKMLVSRKIQVFVNEIKGKTLSGMTLKVNPYSQVVDHVFRFFEQENRQVTLTLPALYQNSTPPDIQPFLVSTNNKASVEWINDKEIQIQLKTLTAPKIIQFSLLAYSDQYHRELLGNWQIEIYCFAGVDINLNMGQLTTVKLVMPGDVTRYVQCYSSDPSMAYFPSPFDAPFTLQIGSMNVINANLRSFSTKTNRIQINCVDINSKELVYSWIIRVSTTPPNISKIYPLTSKVGQDLVIKFNYENKTGQWSIFEFISSHPKILEILDPRIPIGNDQKEGIRIKLKANERRGAVEIFVFVNDQEERIFECMLFRISYEY